jgi:hypothetical protein
LTRYCNGFTPEASFRPDRRCLIIFPTSYYSSPAGTMAGGGAGNNGGNSGSRSRNGHSLLRWKVLDKSSQSWPINYSWRCYGQTAENRTFSMEPFVPDERASLKEANLFFHVVRLHHGMEETHRILSGLFHNSPDGSVSPARPGSHHTGEALHHSSLDLSGALPTDCEKVPTGTSCRTLRRGTGCHVCARFALCAQGRWEISNGSAGGGC